LSDLEESALKNEAPKLKEEIDSWSLFVESLRLEDRETFKRMVEKIWTFSDSVEICKDEYTTEAFLLSILISQQKTIDWLENQIKLLQHAHT
jgi:bacterioferritin (cytochrome b1)